MAASPARLLGGPGLIEARPRVLGVATGDEGDYRRSEFPMNSRENGIKTIEVTVITPIGEQSGVVQFPVEEAVITPTTESLPAVAVLLFGLVEQPYPLQQNLRAG